MSPTRIFPERQSALRNHVNSASVTVYTSRRQTLYNIVSFRDLLEHKCSILFFQEDYVSDVYVFY